MPSPIRYEPVAGDNNEQDSDAFQSQQDAPGQWDEISENMRLDTTSSVSEIDADEQHAPTNVEVFQEVREPMQPDDVPHSTTKPPWQDPVRWCVWGNVAVLAINIIFTVAAVGISASKGNNHGFGSITIYRGSCKTAQYMKIGLHLLLNVLSVAMTATSSYCCTILMAPSRSDVDEAHAKGTWLSIGVSSWRNFWNLKAQSQVLWVLLLVTSMIMQMVYNSVVYSSLNANTYPAIVAPLNFVSNNSVPTSYYEDINCFSESFLNWTIADLRADILNGTFEYLSKEDCLNSYATSYVSNRRTVVLVTKDSLSGDGIPIAGYGYPGGITDMDPSKNMTPNLFASNYDYGQSNVGFDWMCYAGGPDTESCSSSFINGQGEWNVSGQECARLTRVNLYNVNPDSVYSDISFDRSSLAGGYGSMEAQLNGTGVNWTDSEINDLLSYVDGNPTPGQMRKYINHTSWVKSVYDYTSEAKVVQADGSEAPVRGHINVSTYYPHLSNMGSGTSVDVTVDHCLSQTSDEACSIFYQVPIAFTIIICGMIKVMCMLLLLRINRFELLLTVGDAISSFLQRPDPTTRNWCSLSSDVVLSNKECPWNAANKSFEKGNFVPQEYQPDILQGGHKPCSNRIDGKAASVSRSPKEWRHATSARVWAMTLAALISYIVISVLFPSLAVKNSSTHPYDTYDDTGSLTSIWHIKGWGEIESTSLLSSYVSTFLGAVLLSNIPQLAVSFLYYCLNDHLTRCLILADYNKFAVFRRPLRVSFPQGEQRSTFYLTIPYSYAIPLLTSFTLIHWFVSEGLFYVQVLPYNLDVEPVPSKALITCGVSTIPLMSALLLAILAFLVILVLGFRRFSHPRMPLALGMSVVVSAACHPPSHDSAAAYKPVQWGVVEKDTNAEFPHCSFTSLEVEEPEDNV